MVREGWSLEPTLEIHLQDSKGEQELFWPRLNPSGSLRGDYFSSSKTLDDETDFYGITAQLKLLPTFGEVFDGKLEVRLTDSDVVHHNVSSKVTLLEGFMMLHFKDVDLTIGKQSVAWGRADAINPTDNLTPRDYTVLLPFEEDQRFGTTALKLDAHLSMEYTATLFTTFLFEPSKIPLPIPSGATVQNNRKPAHSFSNSEVGLKLNKAGGSTDWSVSYFHGFSLFPEIRFQGLSSKGLLLELRYPEIDVFGADIARNYGRYGFRAEAAYISPRNYSRRETTTIKPYLFYVIGIDRTFFENLNINLQMVGRWVTNYKNPETIQDPVQQALAVNNAILFGQQHRVDYGFTSRISDKWYSNTLEAEMLLVAYLNPVCSYFRPLVTYSFTDHIKGSAGYELYSGTRNSYFGLLKSNSGFFAEVRYTF